MADRVDKKGYGRLPDPPALSMVRAEKLALSEREMRRREGSPTIGDAQILKHILLDPMNILIVGAPAGVVAQFYKDDLGKWTDAVVFGACFIGLLPLAKVLGDATEHIAESLNETIGGLLNATFGNAVEMIITINAIRQGLKEIVKMSLLGSILSNLLLVLGMAFFVGGLTKKEQSFPGAAALINVTMLFVGIMSFSLPTVFSFTETAEDNAIYTLKISRVSAIFVSVGYVAYLIFQLGTHASLFEDEESGESEMGVRMCAVGCGRPAAEGFATCCRTCQHSKGARHGPTCIECPETGKKEEPAILSLPLALLLLLVCTCIVAVLSELMVDSIEGVVKEVGIPEAFVGVILLPIVGNACEHASAVRMAYNNKMATAIAIAVGSSTQIALLVMPFSVIVAWCLNVDLDLNMHPTGLAVMFLSVLVVFSIVMDAKSNWLEGFMLVLSYCLVAVLYWYTGNPVEADAPTPAPVPM